MLIKKVDILGVKIVPLTMEQTVKKIIGFLNEQKNHLIFTPNPEVIMAADKDKAFRNILNEADLVIPDGIGVILASKILKKEIPERVAGCDLIQQIFSRIKNTEKTVYFFGAAPGIAERAAKNMQNTHENLKVIGTRHGFFNKEEEPKIVEKINALAPDILLVGLGVPKQEKWLCRYRNKLNVKVCIGVGGSFDVLSGNIKRAPNSFQKLGLEWLYRLIQQPKRWVRMLQLPLFMLKIFKVRIMN